MAKEVFDDHETQYLGEKYPEYDDMNYGQLRNEYVNVSDLLLDHQYLEDNPKKKIIYEKRYHYLGELLSKMEQEKRVRESTFTSKKNPFERTSWIDDDVNYQQDDKRVIGLKSTKDSIDKFIGNIFKRDRNFRENKNHRWIQNDFVKLTRSFLAYDSGGGTRPLLNN